MARAFTDLGRILKRLQAHTGATPPVPARSAWELVLLEAAAYLVDDGKRDTTFAELSRRIGIAPPFLLAASEAAVATAIAGGGMMPRMRAAKVRECAEIAVREMDGDLDRALRAASDVAARRKLLRRFPGFGLPGADRVLLLAGLDAVPTLDSNGLRSLQRLGLAPQDASYEKAYRAARALLAAAVPARREPLVEAFQLLRRHGRSLCRSRRPLCGDCPFVRACPGSLATATRS